MGYDGRSIKHDLILKFELVILENRIQQHVIAQMTSNLICLSMFLSARISKTTGKVIALALGR